METAKLFQKKSRRYCVALAIAFSSATSAQTDFWQQTNGPFGGDIIALAINNSNGYIFAATRFATLHRSTDNGESWAPVNNSAFNNPIGILKMNSAGHLFVANFDGIYRSTNDGDDWSLINASLRDVASVSTMAINSDGHIFVTTQNSSLFRSTNNGDSWSPIGSSFTSSPVYVLTINQTTGDFFGGTYGDGVYRSADDGVSWTRINTGLTNARIIALVINSQGHIFAGTEGGGMFRSTTNGDTWSAINFGLTFFYISVLAVNDIGDVFAGTPNGMFRSTVNGDIWSRINTGLTHDYIRALAINNSNDNIFAGTGAGVFRSTTNGDNWSPSNGGMINSSVYGIVVNSAGEVFAGTAGGVFRSTDNGDNWNPKNTGLLYSNTVIPEIGPLAINRDGHLFAGTGPAAYRSTNNGDNWEQIFGGNANAFAFNNKGHILIGAFGSVYRSTDNGNNWTRISTGLPDDGVRILAIKSDSIIFAGMSGTGVFRSLNNGDNWNPVNTGLSNTDVWALAMNSAGHIFAGTVGGGVFRSVNNGDTWHPVNAGLPTTYVNVLSIDSLGIIFAGTGFGVYRSADNGDTWNPINSGLTLTNNSVLAFAIRNDGTIFAGTLSRGVFRLVPANLPPNSPTGLAAESDFNKVTLRWSRNIESDLLRYRIYRGAASPANSVIDSVTAGIQTYSDTTVASGTTYFYRISAVDNSGHESNFSNEVQVTFIANQPPVVSNAIPNQTLIAGGPSFILDLEASPAVFNDSDGDALSYAASSTAINVAAAIMAGSTLTVAPVAEGATIITITADDSKGGVQITEFEVTVAANQAPLIVHTPLSLKQSGEEISVEANITDDLDIANAVLSYRRGGESVFQTIAMSKTGDAYQATIPANAVTSRGVEYFVIATDQLSVNSRAPASGVFSIQVRVTNETKPTPQPGGSSQTAYRLIAVPADLDDKSPRAVLEDDLGSYDDTKWRFSELLADQTYVEFPNTSAVTPGKAFWLLIKDAGKIIDTGGGLSNRTDREFKIALHSGWNFVGNPFNFSIPVEKLRLQSGAAVELRSYTGSWNEPIANPVASLAPFEGYALFNESTSADTLLVNPDLSSSPTNSPKQTAARERNFLWSTRISAQCQQARDVDNFAAIASAASLGFDAWDRPEPPPVGEYVSVYFPHRDWQPPTPSYCIDARPEFSQGEIWEFEVATNIRDKVNLTFAGIDGVPDEFEIWIIDEPLRISQDLRKTRAFAVAGSGPDYPKRLKLVVGRHDFVAEKLAKADVIPETYELSQNFPNPFNPATTIRYGLPREERVTMKVYNLLGEEVVILVNDEQRAAGYHAAIWNGRNKDGRIVASGIYVYRLEAGGFTMMKKLALVK